MLTSAVGGTPPFGTPPMLQDIRNQSAPMFSIVRNNSSTSKIKVETSEPTLEIARAMQTGYKTMDNASLVLLAAMDSPPHEEARAEVLKRHIMSVDSVDYQTAVATFEAIKATNREGLAFLFAPHKIGLGVAGIAAVSSYFLCFDLIIFSCFI